jgi:flagellar protein FliS
MPPSARDNYLEIEVRTATPQKLHLMLIESALRSARRAREQWQLKQDEQALGSLIHSQEVLNEMITGMDREAAPDLTGEVAGVYGFIFRSLVRAGHRHDEKALHDAIRILEIERETWRQLCEQPANTHVAGHQHAGPPSPKFPVLRSSESFDPLPTGGLSLEA